MDKTAAIIPWIMMLPVPGSRYACAFEIIPKK